MSLAFRYRAATPAGELVEGVVSAENERFALEELRRQTLVPVAIEADRGSGTRRPRLGASRASAVATAMRTMAALAGGGAPLTRALDFAQRHAEPPDVADALAAVRDEVQSGQSLSAALGARTDLFGALAPAMVRAGEESGTLDTALTRLADVFDRARDLRAQLLGALLYPALLALVAGVGVVVLLGFVVPRFVAMLAETGGTLPRSTRLLVAASHLVTAYWWAWTGVVAISVMAALAWMRNSANRRRWHNARLAWPVTGTLETRTWTARFCRSLGALLQGGAPLLLALRIARQGVANAALGARIDAAIARVQRGDRIAAAFDGVFPPLATQLLAVGEESASLDAMAARVADTYDAEVQRGLRTLVNLVEPVAIVLFGGLVGFIALAMLQAMYSINASVL